MQQCTIRPRDKCSFLNTEKHDNLTCHPTLSKALNVPRVLTGSSALGEGVLGDFARHHGANGLCAFNPFQTAAAWVIFSKGWKHTCWKPPPPPSDTYNSYIVFLEEINTAYFVVVSMRTIYDIYDIQHWRCLKMVVLWHRLAWYLHQHRSIGDAISPVLLRSIHATIRIGPTQPRTTACMSIQLIVVPLPSFQLAVVQMDILMENNISLPPTQ